MSYTEVLTDHDLTAEQWETGISSEYLQQLQWSHVMGESSDMPIQVKMDLSKKAGDAITVGIRSRLKGGHVTGRNKGTGNEGRVDFYGQRITINNDRQLVKVEDVPMSQKRVPWDVLMQAREALVDQSKQQLEDDIMTAACDTATGRVRGRYLYGAADSNWNATHVTAMTNVDNTADQLTTNMLDIAKRKATIIVNATAKIRPMKVQVGQSFQEWFTSFHHPYSLRDMILNDAAWKNAQLNVSPVTSNKDHVLYTGASFKGSWNGVLIYEWDRIPLIASTIQVSHGLLFGAQALAVVWGQTSKFTEDTEDMGHDYKAELHEIRGMSKIVYNRSSVSGETNEDNGVVHIFAAAVAD